MLIHRTIQILILIIGLASVECFASSDKLKNYLSEKNIIISIDWDNIEKSSLYLGGILEDNQSREESVMAGRETIKKGQLIIEGLEFEVELNIIKGDSIRYELLMETFTIDIDTCNKGLAILRKWYDKEKILNDTSNTIRVTDNPDKYEGLLMTFETKDGQWDLGNTRITFKCRGIHYPSPNPSGGFIAVSFSDKKFQETIVPVVTISCSQEHALYEGKRILATQKKADVIFKIDEYNKSVLNQNNNKLKGDSKITDNEIKITKEDEKAKLLYTINRVTGIFFGEVILKDLGMRTEITGKCEKIDLENKKF